MQPNSPVPTQFPGFPPLPQILRRSFSATGGELKYLSYVPRSFSFFSFFFFLFFFSTDFSFFLSFFLPYSYLFISYSPTRSINHISYFLCKSIQINLVFFSLPFHSSRLCPFFYGYHVIVYYLTTFCIPLRKRIVIIYCVSRYATVRIASYSYRG